MAADAVREPFAVINADDFYGAEAYKTIGDYLAQLGESPQPLLHGRLRPRTRPFRTTVPFRAASAASMPTGDLTSMVERTQIERMPDGQDRLPRRRRRRSLLAEDTPVSMNLFGFTPDFFTYSREYFKDVARPPTRTTSRPSSTSRRWSTSSIGDGTAYAPRAPLGRPVARRHLQGGQTRAGGRHREDDCRG